MSQNLPNPTPISYGNEISLDNESKIANITIDTTGNLNISTYSNLTYIAGTTSSDGWIRGTEVLTSAGATSTTVDTAYDSVSGPFTTTLASGVENQTKNVQLYGKYCNNVVVDCTSGGGGTFTLSSADSFKSLKYYENCWNILPLNGIDSFYPTVQQGTKFVGTGATGAARQGYSVAVSKDGNTLAIGGYSDNSSVGATWVFTRAGTTWTQQGAKLIGTGATGASVQGVSVALSANGDTLAVGGTADNTNVGATWVFTRTNGVWTQQGAKLVGTGGVTPGQGSSVALSTDGNTLAVGGSQDNTSVGATWVFTRSGTTWTQQGAKLIGTGGTGSPLQGAAVALSADGNTLAVGGYDDNTNVGATWVFTRSGSTWTQQAAKLVGTGSVGSPLQGAAVALSADGNTLAVSGPEDNTNVGAVWIFNRSYGTWTQQGRKLVATNNVGGSLQGKSVALTSDGNTLLVGGSGDDSGAGAVWTFVKSGSQWNQINKLLGTGNTGAAGQGQSVACSGNGNMIATGGITDSTNAGATWVFI